MSESYEQVRRYKITETASRKNFIQFSKANVIAYDERFV